MWEEWTEIPLRHPVWLSLHLFTLKSQLGRAMAQAVSRTSHRGGLGSIPGQSIWDLWFTKWRWDRFFPECSCFPLSFSFHRCSITRKNGKKLIIIIIFITGLHNKPQGCGASVASAAGLFTTNKKLLNQVGNRFYLASHTNCLITWIL
jgi:hypothetical protein